MLESGANNMDITDDDLYQQFAAAAGTPMADHYEMLYNRLTELVQLQHRLYVPNPEERSPFYDAEGRLVEAVMLGELLHEDGGVLLMRALAYRVVHRIGVGVYSDLSRCWEGIGAWGQMGEELDE